MPRKFDIPSVKKFLFPIIIALSVLATINIAYDLVGEGYAILYTIPFPNEKAFMIAGQCIDEITYFISDILGDIVLFHRVYAIWGSQKKITFPTFLIVLVAKVLSIIEAVIALWGLLGLSDYDKYVSVRFLWMSPSFFFEFRDRKCLCKYIDDSFNCRIWWMSRALQAGTPSGSKPGPQRRWYHKTVAIVVESGVIYPIYLIVGACGVLVNSTCLGVISVGLAPTLIAVRVGLGSAYDDQSFSTMGRSAIIFSPHDDYQRSTAHILDSALVSSRYNPEDASAASVKDGKLSEVV
ncbi:hypothetical protein GYMLUDRAFT_241371 [Collybiopsis luxurians FD-317 M1]|uniref:Uncharacterized protein n=1 Tax=Collybiopsis luxurians FD-317 M1 TaxID=944289 RepID=A0A0D0D499_9AGAR|nr:hypothetical protein GYMLUDRAFT_241371 [Collybiopsis luxurians FD-317 M1]